MIFEEITEKLIKKVKKEHLKLRDILKELFSDKTIASNFSSEIRKSTIIGQMANKIIHKSKLKHECKIMAIGDVKYFKKIEKKWNKLIKKNLKAIDVKKLNGYDIESRGSTELRNTLYSYMSNYYDFSSIDSHIIKDSIIPTYGSTDGFTSIMYSIKKTYKNIKFIYPEASFLSNVNIAKDVLGTTKIKKINKPSKNNFFFSEKQIENLYEQKLKTSNTNVYYIIPVGNPTGSKINKTLFVKIIKKINHIDKNAIFIMDNVYLGLLKKDGSQNMFKTIFKTKKILDRIIFTESLSKTLGATGIRIAWLWTTNNDISFVLKKDISMKKAGFSKILNEFGINLLKDNKKIIKFQNEAFDFWANQRRNFYEYITYYYSDLFDFSSSCNFLNREGIYLLFKVKKGFSKEEIFSETGIIGVGVQLSDGLYIRYSFAGVNYY